MTLLTMIQDVTDLVGIPRPSTVIGSNDDSVRTLLAFANREGRTLVKRTIWQETVKEAIHTTVAAEEQGLLETIAPGFNWGVGRTLWNRSNQEPVNGPLTPQQWQYEKARLGTGPYFEFRIKQRKLYFYPAPAAGQTVAFEYASRYFCESASGEAQDVWEADTDVGILPEDTMIKGIHWRYLQSKGLDYAEAFREYEIDVAQRIARNGGKPILYLDGCPTPAPGLNIPDGSWNL